MLRGSRRYRAGNLWLTCRLVGVVLWVTRYAIFARCANANSAPLRRSSRRRVRFDRRSTKRKGHPGWVLRGSRRYRAGSLCLTCRLVRGVLWVTRYAIFAQSANANSATFVALFDLIHESPKRKKKKQDKCPASLFLVTRGRIELPFQP